MGQLYTMDNAILRYASEEDTRCLVNVLYLKTCQNMGVTAKHLPREELDDYIAKYFKLIDDRSKHELKQLTWRFIKHVHGRKYGMHYEW
tara:strand:+ start:34 stop:300 length:267 start_codon:yes stop_codon:yes gene_type:complete